MHSPIIALALLVAAPPNVPTEKDILKTLRAERPRLIARDADLQEVKRLIAANPAAAKLDASLVQQADKIVKEPPVERKLIGPRLLQESRRATNRIYTLATAYRLHGDRRHLERAVKEMLAAAEFSDWNPSHFLDTAEMTHALAIGYDWLYADLSVAQRAKIGTAIVEKGLRPGEKGYKSNVWWAKSGYNWNQVCNGGMTIGALALADEEPQLAAYIVHQAVTHLPLAMASFAPDGAWGEGPAYWNYATSFNVYMLAALESALGTDFGLARAPGFAKTGDFRMHVTGPSRLTFNFADGSASLGKAPQMFWLARKFDRPDWAWHEREIAGAESALHLWWYDARSVDPTKLDRDRHFRHVDVAMFRSAWNDPKAVYFALKGGGNKVNHSQLELGTFVLDADGERWAMDLGSDNYNLPAYFGPKRWTYYRLKTEGQNTLTFDGANQDPNAVAPITAFHSSDARGHAVVDLLSAYKGSAKSARRGVALVDRKAVLVQDEIDGAAGRDVRWQMHTMAEIDARGREATLKLNGKRLTAAIVAGPADAKFSVESAQQNPPQNENKGVSKLVVQFKGTDEASRLVILMLPESAGSVGSPEVLPLSQWEAKPQ